MVFPIGVIDIPLESMEAPRDVKEHQVVYWWLLVSLLSFACWARLAAMDIFGAINTGLVAGTAYYLVTDDCARMSQCCVLYYGIICVTSAIFDALPLAASFYGGRSLENTDQSLNPDGSKIYTVTVETHPFFDGSMGNFYNFQSCVMVISPLVQLLGAILACKTYNSFETQLFVESDGDDDAAEAFLRGDGRGVAELARSGWGTAPRHPLAGLDAALGTAAARLPAAERQGASAPHFTGRAHRLSFD